MPIASVHSIFLILREFSRQMATYAPKVDWGGYCGILNNQNNIMKEKKR